MSMHPAVRQVLADRLTALQSDVQKAAEQVKANVERARAAEAHYARLLDEKQAIQAQLSQEDAGVRPERIQRQTDPAWASPPVPQPAERAIIHPEGETPPPAERAQVDVRTEV